MGAQQILESIAVEEGWDLKEQIIHLCGYIDCMGMSRGFGDYLDDITDRNEDVEEEE